MDELPSHSIVVLGLPIVSPQRLYLFPCVFRVKSWRLTRRARSLGELRRKPYQAHCIASGVFLAWPLRLPLLVFLARGLGTKSELSVVVDSSLQTHKEAE